MSIWLGYHRPRPGLGAFALVSLACAAGGCGGGRMGNAPGDAAKPAAGAATTADASLPPPGYESGLELVSFVSVAPSDFSIRYLVGSSGPRALSAGRLTAIENGHGERTEISYASAKDDNTTLHQIPYPEIVVGKVKIVRSDKAVTETTYAYGNPLYSFDPLENKFRSFGYGRTVAVTATDSEGRLPGVGEARATITDRAPFVLDPRTDALRMLSVLRGGVVNTVTELAGSLPVASQLLTVNVTNDSSPSPYPWRP